MAAFTTVQVTQPDINKALKNHSSRCVVATAVKRAVPNAKRVEVDMQTIRWTVDDNGEIERAVFVTPASVMDYIVAFDAGDEIQPFTFRLYHDRKATIPSITRNTAARQVDAAQHRVINNEKKQKKVASNPKATKADKVVAAEKVDKAKKELAVVKETLGPEATRSLVKGNATHWRIPRHTKTGRRYFGAKVMRVNQLAEELADEPAVTPAAPKPAKAVATSKPSTTKPKTTKATAKPRATKA